MAVQLYFAMSLLLQVHAGPASRSTVAACPAAGSSSSSSSCAGQYSLEEAAVVLQAAARGYLTRKQLRQRLEREEQAAVLIQVGVQPCTAYLFCLLCCRNGAELHMAVP
jgi:hypothetical protein